MKKPEYLAIVGALLVSLNGYSQGGSVTFANGQTTPVINSLTGQPAVSGLLRAGLYYDINLSAVPNPNAPDDSFNQVGAFTPVLAGGLFNGGTRTIMEVVPGTEVLLQVRAWSSGFGTYEEAYNAGLAGDGSVLAGASILMRIALGGGALPTPSLVTNGLQPFSVTPVPEPSMSGLFLLGGLGAVVLRGRKLFVARPR